MFAAQTVFRISLRTQKSSIFFNATDKIEWSGSFHVNKAEARRVEDRLYMAGSFFIEKSSAKRSPWYGIGAPRLSSNRSLESRQGDLPSSSAAILSRFDWFYPDEINGFFPPVETNGRQFRKACTNVSTERCLGRLTGYSQCVAAAAGAAAAQPLLSVSGLVLQLQKVDRYTTRRARPIDIGHNFVQRACTDVVCVRTSERSACERENAHTRPHGVARVCAQRPQKTPDDVTEKFRRVGARTNVKIAPEARRSNRDENVARHAFLKQTTAYTRVFSEKGMFAKWSSRYVPRCGNQFYSAYLRFYSYARSDVERAQFSPNARWEFYLFLIYIEIDARKSCLRTNNTLNAVVNLHTTNGLTISSVCYFFFILMWFTQSIYHNFTHRNFHFRVPVAGTFIFWHFSSWY